LFSFAGDQSDGRRQAGSRTKKAASLLHFAIASAVSAFYFLRSLDSDILGQG
jgi:hypothetical protein